jgi:triacylglycerol lipase
MASRKPFVVIAVITGLAGIVVGRVQNIFARDRTELPQAVPNRPVVFLLHGLANSPIAMKALEREGKQRGYTVVNWGYRTRNHSVDDIAAKLTEVVKPFEDVSAPIHFVGHSMGGIVIRRMLDTYRPKNLGRVVMIGTPNQGAEIAERLGDWKLFHRLYGQTGQDLRTQTTSTAVSAGIPPCEFGVIAGGTGTRFGMNPVVPGDDDGLVSVVSTRLAGMKDWIRLPHVHGLIQLMPRTVENTYLFLENGEFETKAPRDFVQRDPSNPKQILRVSGRIEGSRESFGQ